MPGSTVFLGGAITYVAVYVAAQAGATMLCVWAPPSDQDKSSYVVSPSDCGVVALSEFVEPIMTVREKMSRTKSHLAQAAGRRAGIRR